jgi:hypothetical protein
MELTENALKVLEARYLLKNEEGTVSAKRARVSFKPILKRKLFLFCVLSLILGALFTQPLSAMMVPVSLEQLTTNSDLIVVGDVEEVRGYRGKNNGIYSIATLRVLDVIKGNVSGETVRVEYGGGHVPGEEFELSISTIEPLRQGERVLLFLVEWDSNVFDGKTYLMGSYLNKFIMNKKEIVGRGGFTMEEGRKKEFGPMHINELKKKIKKIQRIR